MKTTTFNYMVTSNDRNGNPRRLFLAVTTDSEQPHEVCVEAIDEGYEGGAALDRVYPHALHAATIGISAREYRDLLNHFPLMSF